MDILWSYLPIAVALVIFLERIREVGTKRATVPGARQETLTFNLFMVCGIAMIAGGIAEALWRGTVPGWNTLAGIVCAVSSFALRRQAIAALGKFWSLHVEMREGHEFVQTGPFRWMRHPVYFSMILEHLSLALVLNAWIAFAAVMIVFIPTMMRRLALEEPALVAQFGEAYRQYQQTTPLILPWRIPSSK